MLKAIGVGEKKINIARLKHRFAEKYPDNPFTAIILQEPDELTINQLLSKYTTWISVLSSETTKKLAEQIIKQEVV